MALQTSANVINLINDIGSSNKVTAITNMILGARYWKNPNVEYRSLMAAMLKQNKGSMVTNPEVAKIKVSEKSILRGLLWGDA